MCSTLEIKIIIYRNIVYSVKKIGESGNGPGSRLALKMEAESELIIRIGNTLTNCSLIRVFNLEGRVVPYLAISKF